MQYGKPLMHIYTSKIVFITCLQILVKFLHSTVDTNETCIKVISIQCKRVVVVYLCLFKKKKKLTYIAGYRLLREVLIVPPMQIILKNLQWIDLGRLQDYPPSNLQSCSSTGLKEKNNVKIHGLR